MTEPQIRLPLPFPASEEATVALLLAEKRALEAFVCGNPLEQVLSKLISGAEVQTDRKVFGSILLADPSGKCLRHGAAPSLPIDYCDALDGLVIGPKVGSCGTAAFNKAPVVVTDIATDPLWAEFKHLALPRGLRACWSTPILSETGELLGTFALYYKECMEPTVEHRYAIQSLTATAAVIIEAHHRKATATSH